MQIPFLSTATHKLGVGVRFREVPQGEGLSVPMDHVSCIFLLYHVKLDHHWH